MDSDKLANWCLLPTNLLISIVEKLFVTDLIRLRVVCKEWGWSLGWPQKGWPTPPRLQTSFIPIPPSVPWMLLSNEEGADADYCSFLDLSNGQVRRIHPVPEMVGRHCVGASSDGWLVTLDLDLHPRVLNPLNREELPLPSLLPLLHTLANVCIHSDVCDGSLQSFFDKEDNFQMEALRNDYIKKIVLTSAPPSGIAAVIYSSNPYDTQLALARIGDASWTPVSIADHQFRELISIEDIFYHKEKDILFVVTSLGYVFYSDFYISDWHSGIKMSLSFRALKLKSFTSWGDKKQLSTSFTFNRHIIFLSGRLLQICTKEDEYADWDDERLREVLSLDEEVDEDEESDAFIVKVETISVHNTMKQHVETTGWIPCKASDLEDQAIFVGRNHAFSVPAAGMYGVRKNAVYFTDTLRYFLEWKQHVRVGSVFDMETRTFHRFFISDFRFDWPPSSIWFMPSRLHLDFLS